jgi:hypothetical protein
VEKKKTKSVDDINKVQMPAKILKAEFTEDELREEELRWNRENMLDEWLSNLSEVSEDEEHLDNAKIIPLSDDNDGINATVSAEPTAENNVETAETVKKQERSFDYMINVILLNFKEKIDFCGKHLNQSDIELFRQILLRYFTYKHGYKDKKASLISLRFSKKNLQNKSYKHSVSPSFSSSLSIEEFRKVFESLSIECENEVNYISQLNMKCKSQRIMFLFLLDLLSKRAASIVSAKNNRDNPIPFNLSIIAKRLIWFGIFFINCTAFAITFYFILFESSDFQLLWLQCFIFWFFFEYCLVNFMFVLFTHVFLPLSAIGAVDAVKTQFFRLMKTTAHPLRTLT